MTSDSESSSSSCKLVITSDVPNTHTSAGVNLYMKDCMKGKNKYDNHSTCKEYTMKDKTKHTKIQAL